MTVWLLKAPRRGKKSPCHAFLERVVGRGGKVRVSVVLVWKSSTCTLNQELGEPGFLSKSGSYIIASPKVTARILLEYRLSGGRL